MVLQSFRQYRAFTESSQVKKYAENHPSLSRLNEKIKAPLAPPSRPEQNPPPAKQDTPSPHNNDLFEGGALLNAPFSPERSTSTAEGGGGGEQEEGERTLGNSPTSSLEDRQLPGNIVGERVEIGEREKARPTPAIKGEDGDPFLVTWDEDEEANPMNWSWLKKWLLIGMVTSIGLLVGAAASIDSAAATQASEFFGVSTEVVELQTCVFLVGFGLAAPFLGCEWFLFVFYRGKGVC